ncbi:MAG: hypothetical protein ABIO62_07785 [Paracoccaceae bacterium]
MTLLSSFLGLVTGKIIVWMMIKLLTGVVDPPPEAMSVLGAHVDRLLGGRNVCHRCRTPRWTWTSSRHDSVMRDV